MPHLLLHLVLISPRDQVVKHGWSILPGREKQLCGCAAEAAGQAAAAAGGEGCIGSAMSACIAIPALR